MPRLARHPLPDQTGRSASDIFAHVRLLDSRTIEQVEALGTMGVNLITRPSVTAGIWEFVNSLVDNLTSDRVEVDLLKFPVTATAFSTTAFAPWRLSKPG